MTYDARLPAGASNANRAPAGRAGAGVLAGRAGLAVLIDPGRTSAEEARVLAGRAAAEGAALLLVGNSFGSDAGAGLVARAMRDGARGEVPIIQFPGTASQLIADVDAILLLSLVSGRNPQYLIDEHVRAVPFLERHRAIEVISTAYCLIDGGHVTSVEAVSQTRPLPSDKPELVAAHVRAAMHIGMRAAYLDAGSGARAPVSDMLLRAARAATPGPLFVGGGLRTEDAVRRARAAGADFVVVGTVLEQGDGVRDVGALAAAAGA
jgi:putative glycerol-1-phosphate prenyltransferase